MFTFDGPTRLIVGAYVTSAGKFTVDAKADLYSSWKEWVLQGDNSKFPFAMSTTGGDDLGSSFLGSYFFLENGWKIRPIEEAHRLIIDGNLFTRDGSSPFVPTLGAFNVLIEMQNSSLTQAVDVGGSGLTPADIWSEGMGTYTAPDTFGGFIKRLLTVGKFIGLK